MLVRIQLLAASVSLSVLVAAAAAGCSAPIVGTDAGADAPSVDTPSPFDVPSVLDAPAPGDVAVGDDAMLDAAVDAPPVPCRERPWGEPVELGYLNGGNSADARLTDDELHLVMNRDLGSLEWTRATTGAMFASPRALGELDPPGAGTQVYAPSLSRDGFTIYVAADTGTGDLDLYVATRTDVDGVFGTLDPVTVVNGTGTHEVGGFPAPDGIYYWAGPAVGGYDIYFAPDVAGVLGTPMRVAALSATAASEESPVLTADGLTVYFASDRTDPGFEGFMDIYVATRDALGDAFSGPRRVPELSGPTFDRPTWISADECRMYLDRHATGGNYSIYYAERLP